jgi:hypothetical protein
MLLMMEIAAGVFLGLVAYHHRKTVFPVLVALAIIAALVFSAEKGWLGSADKWLLFAMFAGVILTVHVIANRALNKVDEWKAKRKAKVGRGA